jgi:hypothetical protein
LEDFLLDLELPLELTFLLLSSPPFGALVDFGALLDFGAFVDFFVVFGAFVDLGVLVDFDVELCPDDIVTLTEIISFPATSDSGAVVALFDTVALPFIIRTSALVVSVLLVSDAAASFCSNGASFLVAIFLQ